MTNMFRKIVGNPTTIASFAAIALIINLGASSPANADEQDAKDLLKAMSDYLAAQKAISIEYDSAFEVVTTDHQKLLLANSGVIHLNRPDKLRATRSSGFGDFEVVFDGKTVSMLSKYDKAYTQIDAPGSVDQLIDQLRDKFQKPIPGADLLSANVYDVLMADVIDIKDLGSGVIGGTECDHLGFRTKELDFQIWIAHGDRPYPCRYVITSKEVDQAPQFSIQVRSWSAGDDVAPVDFSFKAPADARKLETKDFGTVRGADELPSNYSIGETQ